MPEFLYRTEDIKPEEILGLYVGTQQDERIVQCLTSTNPIILEGSRGTGKSFLMRVAEAKLGATFAESRILPVYVSFVKSSLIHTADPFQFQNWMLATLCSRIVRALQKRGMITRAQAGVSILAGQAGVTEAETKIESIAKQYEESYRSPGLQVDQTGLPDVAAMKDAVEDICLDLDLKRISVFFDEAAHIFRPEQQRQFFTMFRDLRSPYLSCNAAVYPGVTSYGPSFELAHDATILPINRDLLDGDYVKNMQEIVEKQAESDLMAAIARNLGNFATLAYAVSGNPRLLLKTVARAPKMNSSEVSDVIKRFYRTDIWSEHSSLVERYAGHRELIDWGRTFVENTVLPDTKKKNDLWRSSEKTESTCYFWVHRDAPAVVHEALRLLAYTGIVHKGDSGIRATRGEVGTRYSVNLGCLLALEVTPNSIAPSLVRELTPRRFTEYGSNFSAFSSLANQVGQFIETDTQAILTTQLEKPIAVLDMTEFQRHGLGALGLVSVGDVLRAKESTFMKIPYVGPKRSRQMMNIAVASVLEYLSG